MYKNSLQIIVLLLVAQVTFAQQLRDPLSAKNPAELELIFKENFSIQQKVLVEKAATLNYPARVEFANGTIREMVGISPTGMPIYVQTSNNLDAAKTISTNKVWPAGSLGLNLSGAGMTNRMGVWDGGAVRVSHQEFQSRATQTDGASSLSDHATHVAGTMSAGGVMANAKGMSFQAPIKCHDWNNDNSEMSSAAGAGLLVSNHSYSQISGWQYNSSAARWEFWGDPSVSTTEDYKYGFYDNISAQWDQIILNYPNYLPFVAAGNDRGEPGTIPSSFYIRDLNGNWVLGNNNNPPSIVGPYNCISGGPGNAKNVLTVGAVNKITTGWQNPNNVVMSSFSGWGPTDDGRIKPDVVANGVAVYSPISTTNVAYSTFNGTSMATPNASGSALLVQQHYNNLKGNFMRASTLKGLIIHTADEAGTSVGPDYTFGWGLMNTAKAVTTISDTSKNLILQNTLNNISTYNYTFFSDGTSPLRATICWTDRPGSSPSPSLNPTTKMLVNDLDIRVKRNSDNQIFSPYVLNRTNPSAAATTGDNTLDNVEQVHIALPTAGTYTITISKKGSLVGSTQEYALIISGITPKPSAAFTTVNQVICTAKATVFTDQSSGATSRMWYFPGGTPSTSTALNPSITYAIPGVYPVALRISSTTGYDSVYKDDYITVGGMTLPLNETFEPTSLTKNFWSIENPNNDSTWRLYNVAGTTPGNTAYGINNFDYPTVNYLDRLVSPVLDLRGYQNALLEFQHAYTRYDKTASDSLIIYISTNCGTSYTKIAGFGENGKGNFATALDTNFASSNRFIPSKATDWCGGGVGASCFSLNLTPYVGFNNVRIRFEQKSAGGNIMYIDNVKITATPNAPTANFYSILKTVCVGDELQLLDSSLNKPDKWNWYFTDADTLTANIRNPKVKFLTPGTKTIALAVSNINGKDSITRVGYINVLPSPIAPSISSSNGLNLCNGDSTVISTDATTGFIWYKDNLVFSTSLTSFKVKDEAKFYVKLLGSAGCTASSPTLFIQTGISPAIPTITKDLSGNNFCEGGAFNLTSSSANNNQWYINDTLFKGATAKTLNYNDAGKFKVSINDKVCFSFSDSLVINKLAKPNTSPITGTTWAIKGDTAAFSIVPGLTGSIFTWTPVGATIITGAGSKDVSLKMGTGVSAVVNVQETSSGGCAGDKKSLSVNLVSTGLNQNNGEFNLTIYPNPVYDKLSLRTDTKNSAELEVMIFTILGQQVSKETYSISGSGQQRELTISALPAGMYILKVKAGDKTSARTFIKD
jgi:PKD repeat protein